MFDNFDFRQMAMMVVPVLLALTIHEFAHALVAHRLGDHTAKDAGRLTMNPLAHLDPLGTFMLFFSGLFGWAKPVPFNPANFKNPARDTTLVALAGPVSNFLAAIAVYLLFRGLVAIGFFEYLNQNQTWLIVSLFRLGVELNILLAIFNLLPIPPLDGFKVLAYFLPYRWVRFTYQYQTVFLIAFLVLAVSGVLQKFLAPVLRFVFQLIAG